jgi:hypothetical protein
MTWPEGASHADAVREVRSAVADDTVASWFTTRNPSSLLVGDQEVKERAFACLVSK